MMLTFDCEREIITIRPRDWLLLERSFLFRYKKGDKNGEDCPLLVNQDIPCFDI
jgi:hypothetical protein